MDASLLTEVGAHERLVDWRLEGAKQVQSADCREQQDAIGIDKVCRENDDGLGADLDLADEGGYQESASDRSDVQL
jgi:hypothetical protein